MKAARFETYEARDGWRWRFVAANGRVMADGAEAYATERNVARAADRFIQLTHKVSTNPKGWK